MEEDTWGEEARDGMRDTDGPLTSRGPGECGFSLGTRMLGVDLDFIRVIKRLLLACCVD